MSTRRPRLHPNILAVQRRIKDRSLFEAKRDRERVFHEANRLKRLPQYLFSILDDLKAQARASGTDVIDLGMGNPDVAPPTHVVAELARAIRDPENHRYSRTDGPVERRLREAIAQWYHTKFRVTLDPWKETLPLIGSKEGIAHLSFAFLNHDDIAIVPSPAYPVHFNGVIMAGGLLYSVPMTEENHYLPDLTHIPKSVLKQSKMLIISYPNNPTTAVANIGFFRTMVDWCRAHHIMLIHDFAYSDFVYDGHKAPSVLQVPGASKVAVEFHTMSKSYSMPGWRLGFCVGNREILASLAKTKHYVDFGIFRAVQWGAVKALTGPQEYVTDLVDMYRHRRDVFVKGLHKIGWDVTLPKGTFYVWAKIPLKFHPLTSLEFATLLMQEAGVVVSPGTGFGDHGEGFVRFALVAPELRLQDAVRRIERVLQMQD